MTRRSTITCDRCHSSDREEDASDEWLMVTIAQVDQHNRIVELCPVCSHLFADWLTMPPKLHVIPKEGA